MGGKCQKALWDFCFLLSHHQGKRLPTCTSVCTAPLFRGSVNRCHCTPVLLGEARQRQSHRHSQSISVGDGRKSINSMCRARITDKWLTKDPISLNSVQLCINSAHEDCCSVAEVTPLLERFNKNIRIIP